MKKRCLYIIACMFLFFIFFAFFIEENALVFAFEKEVIEDENEIDTCENVLGNRVDDFIKSSEVPIRNKVVKNKNTCTIWMGPPIICMWSLKMVVTLYFIKVL